MPAVGAWGLVSWDGVQGLGFEGPLTALQNEPKNLFSYLRTWSDHP